MKAIRDLWEEANGSGSVVGLAPSAVAAAVLGEEIDAPTDNVAKWLYESAGDGAAAKGPTDQQTRNRGRTPRNHARNAARQGRCPAHGPRPT